MSSPATPALRTATRPVHRLAANAAAVAMLLAGCAVSSPVPAPMAGVALPLQWTQPQPPGTGGLTGWWHVFDDALLVELIGAAQGMNTDIGIATARLRQARAARQEAAAALGVAVTGSAGVRRGAGAGERPASSFGVTLDAAWEADLFGASGHGLAAQEASVRAGVADLGATQVSIAAEVALAYLDTRNAQVRAAVTRDNLATQQETLQISQWRQQAGLASSLEVEQARAAVEQTRAQVPGLESAAVKSAHALAVLTGRPPAELLDRLAATAGLPLARDDVLLAAPADVLRQRPDIHAAEQRVLAAAERVGQADAARFPQLAVGGSLAWSGLTLGTLGSVSAARSLALSITQPLIDHGRLAAQLAGRRAEFDAAQLAWRASLLQALREVEDALVALAATREQLDALQLAAQAAGNASLLATQRQASGLIDFQTVLETQRTLLNLQGQVVAAQAELGASHVRLYKALGGGWRMENAS